MFCPSATWNPNASIVVDTTIIGSQPYSIFVDTNNSLYAASWYFDKVYMWLENSKFADRTLTTGLTAPIAVFATTNGDIYVDNGFNNSRVDK